MKSSNDEDSFIQIIITPGSYEIERLNSEIKRIIIDKELYSEKDYPLKSRPKFSTRLYPMIV